MFGGGAPFEVYVVQTPRGENVIGFTSYQRAVEYIKQNYPDWAKDPESYIDFLIVDKFD